MYNIICLLVKDFKCIKPVNRYGFIEIDVLIHTGIYRCYSTQVQNSLNFYRRVVLCLKYIIITIEGSLDS